jgi:anti-sigma factor RsiW
MNDCPESVRLGAYRDGELPPADCRRLEEHLLDCPACAAEMSRLSRCLSLIAAARPAEAPAALLARLHRAADQQPRLTGVLHLAEAFAAIAATILLASVIWLIQMPAGRESSAQAATWEAVAQATQESSATPRDQLAQLVEYQTEDGR